MLLLEVCNLFFPKIKKTRFKSLTFNSLTDYYRVNCSIEVNNYVEIATQCIIHESKENGVRLINNKQVMSAVLQNMSM